MVAVKYKNDACAALLNPLAPEPLTWPAPLKFISELNPDAKSLLEKALIEANKRREQAILTETSYSVQPQPEAGIDDDTKGGESELCCICFEQVCTIEVETCGHQMCAHCILALCCHSKPNSSTNSAKIPVCPFCRSSITRLAVAKAKSEESETELEPSPTKPKRTRKALNLGESSSFKSLSSFGRLGRGSGKVAAECNEEFEKSFHVLD